MGFGIVAVAIVLGLFVAARVSAAAAVAAVIATLLQQLNNLT